MIVFSYYGGKNSHLKQILPLLPECKHYVEPFGGSAAVLLNRCKSPIETYNDLNGDVVNFFKVLRDAPEELIEKLRLTPYSREEFRVAIGDRNNDDPIERARLLFLRISMAFGNKMDNLSQGHWSHIRTIQHFGLPDTISKWIGRVNGLEKVAERLLYIQIENSPADYIIRAYDSSETLFYCDPPYPKEARRAQGAYGDYDMSDKDQWKLANLLNSVKGMVALSTYNCPLMRKAYQGWNKYTLKRKALPFTRHGTTRYKEEILYTNYQMRFPRLERFPREFSP